MFRETCETFTPEQKFKGDLAYKGEDVIDTPIKKPKNGKLTNFRFWILDSGEKRSREA